SARPGYSAALAGGPRAAGAHPRLALDPPEAGQEGLPLARAGGSGVQHCGRTVERTVAESDELMNSQNEQATQTGQEMPKYRCHKEVWALKIKAIRPNAVHEVGLDTGSCLLEVEEPYFAPVFVTADYMR